MKCVVCALKTVYRTPTNTPCVNAHSFEFDEFDFQRRKRGDDTLVSRDKRSIRSLDILSLAARASQTRGRWQDHGALRVSTGRWSRPVIVSSVIFALPPAVGLIAITWVVSTTGAATATTSATAKVSRRHIRWIGTATTSTTTATVPRAAVSVITTWTAWIAIVITKSRVKKINVESSIYLSK